MQYFNQLKFMKHLLLIFQIILSIHCLAQENWQKELDEIKTPAFFDSQNTVYFRYKEPVEGYAVTGKSFPIDKTSETGNVILSFKALDSNEVYLYINSKDNVFTNKNIYDLVLNADFAGFNQGDVYQFSYIDPDSPQNIKCNYSVKVLHPLGYYTPFQFLDVDFDGEKELLINDWGQYRTGNNYMTYDLADDGLVLVEGAPFDSLSNMDEIDFTHKTITKHLIDGVFEYVKFYYSLKSINSFSKSYPKFCSWMAESQANEPIHPRFALDSVYERVHNEEYHWNLEGKR